MKKISIRKSGSGVERVFRIVLIPLTFLGLVQLFMDYENAFMKAVLPLAIMSPMAILIYRSLKPNTIFWNRMGFNANLGGKFGSSVSYSDIKEVLFEDDTLIIKRLMSKDLKFDLGKYSKEEQGKLMEFMADKSKLYGSKHYRTSRSQMRYF